MRRVVVTGANRGLGLEFTRQLLAAGDEVISVIAGLTPEDSGSFPEHSGGRLEW